MYKIMLYEDARGNCPMEDFMYELNKKASADKKARTLLKKVMYTVDLLKQNGTRSGEKFTKQIEGKLWEMRPDSHRVFFFVWNGNHIILLHTFRKEGRKTPVQEIKKAKHEMDDWMKRHGY
ncbi:type II toxin-antitoxin system RelE/ParE family toxin [Paenibacillus agilis]|uniref:Type II toxin-antitoxin system RelE/ParE family toxin n=1 Tax=Paenibacillus agilis TaxID=3020863 RepID=A0A559IY42_9BACL|nr:type II toxin-antitoxin system RelE/ParE family toxin [Paenibacillus agilis]TVX92554.1 type II toxin-antitoxin system RelE/ParE family toxin [Paenibacillus agilis]